MGFFPNLKKEDSFDRLNQTLFLCSALTEDSILYIAEYIFPENNF